VLATGEFGGWQSRIAGVQVVVRKEKVHRHLSFPLTKIDTALLVKYSHQRKFTRRFQKKMKSIEVK
jgi:hypothetical protein